MENAEEQLNLFAQGKTVEEKMFDVMRPALDQVLAQNHLPSKFLVLKARKGFYALSFRGNMVLRISSGKKMYLDLPTPGNPKALKRIKMDTTGDVAAYLPEISAALQNEISNIKPDFDCCSLYEACSDATHCVHPDADFSLKCGYRKVLQSGRIFYGKNRNIE